MNDSYINATSVFIRESVQVVLGILVIMALKSLKITGLGFIV